MSTVIAIDAGTTGVRAIAFDRHGSPTASAYREFTQFFPRPGWVEHDAAEIWTVTLDVLAELGSRLTEPAAAVGITNQRETVVVWDRRDGRPLHNAIVWQDRRTASRCDRLESDGNLPLVRERTGLVLDPYFSGSKLGWLFDEGGVVPDEHLAFGTVDSWLIWNLTAGGAHVTDTTNASRTLLFDIRSLEWSPELLELFTVPASCLPEVRPSSGRFGVTADGLPVPAGIPISGVAGDQQAALFGQACFAPGDTKNTYGTGSFLLMNVGETCPDPVDGLLTTVAWSTTANGAITTNYALEGAIFVTGAAVQWLRDGLGIIDRASDLEALALACDDSGGVVFVPAFVGLGSPWWDPYARGTICGLTRGSGRPQIARAVIDAMVHQTRDVVDAMSAASGTRPTRLRVDGGASVMRTLLQQQADQLGIPVSRPKVEETTALGAAYLAGLAEGVWDSYDDISNNWLLDAHVQPGGNRETLDAAHAQWRRGVDRARGWERA
ncbi:MAG: glycerol kinase GlpK [Acidimicrobiia bacterium]|nr:glycerol kinase GlpK [Acidimicrobiia bacterium]